MSKSIDIIRNEHEAMADVLQGLRAIVHAIRSGEFEPDFQLLSAMIYYITEVPEVLHHTKEDDFLFPRVRARSNEAATIIEKLMADHETGYELTSDLEHALIAYQAQGKPGFDAFDQAVQRYLAFTWSHMNVEERELLPLARRVLTAEDWAAIDAAFAENGDPWSGPSKQFEELFTKIGNLAPAPIGVGPVPTGGKRRGKSK